MEFNWSNITREERYFCAELFFSIKGREMGFVQWLNKKTSLNLIEDSKWEVGFEVCFYRDFITANSKDKKYNWLISQYSRKRTFDLCLFSLPHVIIIEAKSRESFTTKQNNDFKNDREQIKILLSEKYPEHAQNVDVKLISLTPSRYLESRHRKIDISFFNANITWKDLSGWRSEDSSLQSIFKRAEDPD